jgi:hypothetical protein
LALELRGIRYRLPCRADGVSKALARQRAEPRFRKPEHVRSVAWRILRDWVAAQLAIIESQMVDVEEVYLPYQIVASSGETVYEVYLRSDRMLPG